MNTGIPLALFCVCGWPLIVHFAILYGMRYIASRDWQNIQWQNVKLPWQKEDEL